MSFIIIFGTLSFPISASIPSGLRWERATASEWLPFPCTPTVRADRTMQSLHQSRASLDNTATTQPSRPRGSVRHCSTQHSLSTHHLYTQSALTFWSFLPRDAMLARKLFLQTKDEKQNSQFLIKSHYFNGYKLSKFLASHLSVVCNVARTERHSGLCTNSVRTACPAQAWYFPRSRRRKTHLCIQRLVGILQCQRQTEDLCFHSLLHSHSLEQVSVLQI